MKSNEFIREMTSATPDVPEHFHLKMEMVLDRIVSQEADMKESTKQTIRKVSRFSTRTVVLAAALMIMMLAVALAATQWHLFDSISFLTGTGTPKNADKVTQHDLYKETINNVEISVDEAAYDGRTLLVQYRYRILDTDKVFGLTAKEVFGKNLPEGMQEDTIVEGISEEAEELLRSHHVGWWIDDIWINGKEVDMPNNSGSVTMGSNVPGEIIHTEYWRLDNEGVFLTGESKVSLPIGECQSLKDYYPAKDHAEKFTADGSMLLPKAGMVTFTYDATQTSTMVKTTHPNHTLELPEVTAQVSEAVYSPLMTYITLELEANPDALKAYLEENGEGYTDDEGNLLFAFSGMNVFEDWLMELELVDGEGKLVFPDTYGQNGYGDKWAEFLYPYMETVPSALYLAPIENGKADMSRALQVNP